MRAVMPRASWVKLLSVVDAIIDRKCERFAAQCTLLEVDAGTIEATGTDLQLTVVTSDGIPGKSEAGKALLHARSLLERIRACPDLDVEVKVDDKGATIKSGKRKFSLGSAKPEDYPVAPQLPKSAVGFEMRAGVLARLLGAVEFAVCPDGGMYHSVRLRFGNELARSDAMTTKGMATAWATVPDAPVAEALLSLKASQSVRRLCEAKPDEVLTLAIAPTMMRVSVGTTELMFPLVAQQQPDMDPHIREPETCAEVKREQLLESLKSLAVAAEGPVKLTASSGELHLEVRSDSGQAVDSLECIGEFPATNLPHEGLIQALGTLSSDRVEIVSNNLLTILRDADGDKLVRHVRMPIQV